MALKENVKNNSLVISLSKIRSSELFWVITFTVLTFLAAQVEIPTQPVPFTLQTVLVLLAGAFLGARNGAYSQIVYLALGVIGIPVYAGFSFGLAKIFGPTGGYLLSFPFAAYLVGYVVEKKSGTLALILSFVLGQLLILFVGAAFLAVFMNGDFSKAMFSGVVIFSVWDIIKISAAVSIYKAVSKKYPKLP
ncbi:MAG: biotin transporter BioY [Bacteroidetes bacterium]|nr:biotin transporter BioY [Bacteroidota bacterium]